LPSHVRLKGFMSSNLDLLGVPRSLLENDQEALRLLRQASLVPARSGYGPQPEPRDEVLASPAEGIQNVRASSSTAVKRETRLPAEFQQVADLEDSVVEQLSALLDETKAGVQAARSRASRQADAAVARGRRCCAEAELEYLSLRLKEAKQKPQNASEVGMLAQQVLAMRPTDVSLEQLDSQGAHLQEQVRILLEACRRRVLFAPPGPSENSLAAQQSLDIAARLGDLLLEVDRDCQAMALALSGPDSGLPEGWVELLALAATHGAAADAPEPSLAALERQLSLENEMLRTAIRRSHAPKGS